MKLFQTCDLFARSGVVDDKMQRMPKSYIMY